jgi:Mn-dependent DtxR family transcriptional regulator
MLEILYSRGVISIAELARLLQTNPRNIPEYKKALEEAGYIIDQKATIVRWKNQGIFNRHWTKS